MKEKMRPLGVGFLFLFLGMPAGGGAQTCSQAQLNTEFFSDPTTRGYVSCATDGNLAGPNVDDTCVLTRFNALCTDNPACKQDATVSRETVWEAIDPTELETLYRSTAANDVARKGQLEVTMHQTTFNMGLGTVRQKLFNIFTSPGSPLTNAALVALQQKDVPRCQVVCRKGSGCTLSDVSLGLRGTP